MAALLLTAGDVRVAITGPPAILRRVSQSLWLPHEFRRHGDFRIELYSEVNVREDGAGYRVEGLGDEGFETTVEDLASTVGSFFISQVAEQDPLLTLLHAGVVEVGGAAVVLVGQAESGKSRAVEALVRAGAGYLSDEYAPIDDDLFVLSWPRPLRLREHSELGPGSHAPETLGGRQADRTRYPVAAVYLLQFDPLVECLDIAPMRPAESIVRLVPHAFSARTSRMIERLRRLASAVPVFAGRRGEADQAARALLAERVRLGR